MNDFNYFRFILDANISNLLSLLPTKFTSGQFIDRISDLLPNEYARILSGRSYKTLNVWVARWYLQSLSERDIIRKNNRKQVITTRKGSKSSKNVWSKH